MHDDTAPHTTGTPMDENIKPLNRCKAVPVLTNLEGTLVPPPVLDVTTPDSKPKLNTGVPSSCLECCLGHPSEFFGIFDGEECTHNGVNFSSANIDEDDVALSEDVVRNCACGGDGGRGRFHTIGGTSSSKNSSSHADVHICSNSCNCKNSISCICGNNSGVENGGSTAACINSGLVNPTFFNMCSRQIECNIDHRINIDVPGRVDTCSSSGSHSNNSDNSIGTGSTSINSTGHVSSTSSNTGSISSSTNVASSTCDLNSGLNSSSSGLNSSSGIDYSTRTGSAILVPAQKPLQSARLVSVYGPVTEVLEHIAFKLIVLVLFYY